MSDIKTIDSFSNQANILQMKNTNYRNLINRRKSMTWEEINKEAINNHPTKYFDEIKQLNVPLKVKLDLMGQFFQQQLDLIQVQQSLSVHKVKIGPPINTGSAVLDSSTTSNEESPSIEVTRSGRVTKRTLFYQGKLDELKIKPFRSKAATYEKKESAEKSLDVAKTRDSKAVRGVLSKYEQKHTSLIDSLLMDDDKYTSERSVLSEYEQKQNDIFDSLLMDDDKSTSELNISEEMLEKTESNENLSSVKSTTKRKYKGTPEEKQTNEMDDLQLKTRTPKKSKKNRFFKSKNNSDIIVCDTSDSEEFVVSSQTQSPDKTTNANIQQRGRVSPPVITRKRIRKKVTNQNATIIPQIKCPICNQLFAKEDIDVIHFREEPSQEPDHTVGLKLLALELRLDYMGTSVLMARVSALEVTLRDEWKLVRKSSIPLDAFMPTRRPAVIFMHGELGYIRPVV